MTTTFHNKVETALAGVAAMPQATRRAIFTEFDPERIRAGARDLIARHEAGEDMPLFGTLVSVKDLYDEAGQITGAGSRLMAEDVPARTDATAVARLKAAGALMFGRTSMSEFAYSGVGLNPHHGTPASALAEGVIPGGSSSGGAVSVALGIVDAAIGTDTGGSLRIPAAANGLWGMKPTCGLIDDTGIHALAPSFDTAGAMTREPDLLHAMLDVMSGTRLALSAPDILTLAVPEGAFTDGISPEVTALFAGECARLTAAGHRLVMVDLGFLGQAVGLNKIIVAAEAFRIYGDRLDALEEIGDPRVLSRIRFAQTLSNAQVDDAMGRKAEVAAMFDRSMQGFDAAVTPTLMQLPPTIEEVDADFDRLNAAMLRNTSLVNLADGCALALPTPGLAPAWSMTMLVGRHGGDAALLATARRVAR